MIVSRKFILAVSLMLFAIPILGQQTTDPAAEVVIESQPAVDTTPQSSQGIWMAVGPNMEILPVGTYRFIFVPADANKEVQVTTINMGDGPPPPPPPPTDLQARFKAAVDKTVADPSRKATATGLAAAYQELINSAEQIADHGQLVTAVNMLTQVILAGKNGWADFTNLLSSSLAACTSIAEVVNVLKVAAGELEKVP
jgi:hypothetical protein